MKVVEPVTVIDEAPLEIVLPEEDVLTFAFEALVLERTAAVALL